MIQPILFLSVQAILLILLLRIKKNYSNTKISLLTALFIYISIVIIALYTDYILNSRLETFDLNGDGMFSGKEINEEQRKAMKAVVSDNGRNLAPITGIIFAVFYFAIIRVTLGIFRRKKTAKV